MALGDNLSLHWKMNAISGDETESGGSGNTLVSNGAPGSVAGIINNGRDFESSGAADYFSLADNATISWGDNDRTWRVWVRLESKTGIMIILGKWASSGNYEYLLYYDSSSDRFVFFVNSDGGPGGFAGTTAHNHGSPSIDTWYCIHAWHDSVNNLVGISVNAGTANTTSHSFGVFDGTSPLNVGRNDDGDTHYFDGVIDEIAMWNRTLSSSDRTEDYNGGSGRSYEYLVGIVENQSILLAPYYITSSRHRR